MRARFLLLILLFFCSGFVYYLFVESREYDNEYNVTRVVDGDTIHLDNGLVLRLKGINAPEKNMFGYNESFLFLKKLLEGKVVYVKHSSRDRYNRFLGYVFLEKENVNLKMIKEGLAHLYYYDKDNLYDIFKKEEEISRLSQKGIWKRSFNYGCLEIYKFQYKELSKRCSGEEFLILKNLCDKNLSFYIKDDSSRINKGFVNPKGYFIKNYSCFWNDEGDSIYIWDEEGIILFYRY